VTAINAPALAQWALMVSRYWLPLRLPGSRRGRKQSTTMPRSCGRRFLATFFFLSQLSQWHLYVTAPRKGIERYFAWAKRYFGSKRFQCWTLLRVSQYVLLTYCIILGVALTAQRYR